MSVIEKTVGGTRKVKIQLDKYDGLLIGTTRNGYQWSTLTIDDDFLDVIVECIKEYQEHTQ